MNAHPGKPRRSLRLLRWIFRKGNLCLTCQLDREGRQGRPGAYILSLVPHWNVGQALIERHLGGMGAFQRHAAIAHELRHQGWSLDTYTGA